MRITSEGQVTIPAEVREQAGFRPGEEVEFVVEGDTIRIRRFERPEHETPGDRAVRAFRGTGKWPAETTDEVMLLLRGDPSE